MISLGLAFFVIIATPFIHLYFNIKWWLEEKREFELDRLITIKKVSYLDTISK